MKETLLNILEDYLLIFPEEQERQKQVIEFISNHTIQECTDWNNFDGHIVASGFVYSIKDEKFLVLFHKDLKLYLYPGGHVDSNDESILSAAQREVKEETGLKEFELIRISKNEMVPIDIDTQYVEYNERLKLPGHFHYDFRYLFMIDKISEIHIDLEELSDYKWISTNELRNDNNYGKITKKIEGLLPKKQKY